MSKRHFFVCQATGSWFSQPLNKQPTSAPDITCGKQVVVKSSFNIIHEEKLKPKQVKCKKVKYLRLGPPSRTQNARVVVQNIDL